MNMTEGKILKPLIFFAIPYILSDVFQNIYTLADTAIAGQLLGLNSFAAVGAAGSIVSLCISTITGFMSGFSIVVGIRLGENRISELKTVFTNSLIIVLIVSIFVTLFGMLSARNMLKLLNTPDEILNEAALYLKVIFAGISTTMIYNFLCGMMRAIGNSKVPLYFLIISSVLHIILNYVFILFCGMNVVGAALSTVISQGLSAILCFIYMYKTIPCFKIGRQDIVLSKKTISECLKVGIPMAFTNFIVGFGVLILQFVTNGIGTEYIAAYAGASKIGYIYTSPIFGFASALAVFASQNFGAKNMSRIKTGIRKVMFLLVGINFCVLIFSLIFTPKILGFMIKDGENAIRSGNIYLIIRMVSAFILIPAACYKNVLPALKRTFYPTLSGFAEVAIRFISPVLLVRNFGFIGVPLTDTLSWAVLAILFIVVSRTEIKKCITETNSIHKI